ncbi:type VI secretion protein [Pseudomonas sp. A3.4]|nr:MULTISPECIES: type VI secretion protein [Atopomonas]MCJ8170447.1 type VI secretion protein [Atopomonas sediminilitoris]
MLCALFALTACTGNYKYSDDEYRPLGEPTAVNRGV